MHTVEKAVNRASFVWSNWSKNSPVETIRTKINETSLKKSVEHSPLVPTV